MPNFPQGQKIYHITHGDNLPAIVASEQLVSDAVMTRQGGPIAAIGISGIKLRRLQELTVSCHQGTYVGEYVPFYYCPRSIMLYLLYCGNHKDLAYLGGQEPIVHLEADLQAVVDWANSQKSKWAVSLSNAGAKYTQFRTGPSAFDDLNWLAITNNDFRSPDVKEAKQAELLVHACFPWKLIERIGVASMAIGRKTLQAISPSTHHPEVNQRTDWYF